MGFALFFRHRPKEELGAISHHFDTCTAMVSRLDPLVVNYPVYPEVLSFTLLPDYCSVLAGCICLDPTTF